MGELDIIIKNTRVVDGAGNPWYRADVGVSNGKIEFIGNIGNAMAPEIIEAEGSVLCPGFIDAHSHSDTSVFHDASSYNKLEQGITTEIVGHCGLSFAPVSEKYSKHLEKSLSFLTRALNVPEKWAEFTTFDRFLHEVEKLRLGTNMAFFAGQGTIRTAVMGFENRIATKEESEKMKGLVREAMESGALGLSSGLIYAPGVFTPKDELIELCKIIGEYGGIYATHIRNESDDVINAVKEAIETGRQSGVPIIISHHKIAGKKNWGKSVETLELIEKANTEGLNVALDQYPYMAGCTTLSATLPPEYHEGGMQKLLERIKDTSNLDEIRRDILEPRYKWENFVHLSGFDGILVQVDGTKKTVVQYAKEKDMDPIEAIIDILIKTEGSASAIYFTMDEGDMERIMKYPYTIIGTDSTLAMQELNTHPRAVGAFPRILGRYVREKKMLKLEEVIQKMTSLPAQKIGLKNKGLVKEGYDADLVIFNPGVIIDRADYVNNCTKNEGIHYVIVNGRIAVKDNLHNGVCNGKVVRAK
ncbi:MAG: D-aminoacylase [Ruminiclostridium sp.]|nr:D-aminoacylase [Ruminiclostridium sp.]